MTIFDLKNILTLQGQPRKHDQIIIKKQYTFNAFNAVVRQAPLNTERPLCLLYLSLHRRMWLQPWSKPGWKQRLHFVVFAWKRVLNNRLEFKLVRNEELHTIKGNSDKVSAYLEELVKHNKTTVPVLEFLSHPSQTEAMTYSFYFCTLLSKYKADTLLANACSYQFTY